ncbi:Translational regulator CsrA [Frankliniella fusca]|uniref:Translational regulator CsrA n=1 Tax=Frankliniella fusca TaxID=407009 RepID=A0AAE1HL81_9NEOP|nr:Translational regulator CsrA [Frankliniella fusca]
MVLEEKSSCFAVRVSEARDTAAKRAGYDAVRRAEAERQRQKQLEREKQAKKEHGSWGPVFKNRQHFNSLHMC